MKGIEYRGINSVEGPIVAVRRSENVSYNEVVYVRDKNGEKKKNKNYQKRKKEKGKKCWKKKGKKKN